MQDYHIYTHYVMGDEIKKTSPKHIAKRKKTQQQPISMGERAKERTVNIPTKPIVGTLALASKVNTYIGNYTENTVTSSRRGAKIAYAGMAAVAFKNPILAGAAIGYYTAEKLISYELKTRKENVNAEFMRNLSGGVSNTRG